MWLNFNWISYWLITKLNSPCCIPRGVASVIKEVKKTRTSSDWLSWKEYNPWWVTSHAQRYRFFTWPAVRTGLLWKIPPGGALRLTTSHFAFWGKDYYTQCNIHSFLLTSLTLSFLLHNLISKELFEEASKGRNNKQEEKRKKSNGKENWRESLMLSFTL